MTAPAGERNGSVDLNADLGETDPGLGGEIDHRDLALLRVVTTAHVACGFHAGGPSLMARTTAAAVAAGVTVGAHPSYPDREGFGRRPMDVPAAEVADYVVYQLGALDAIARRQGACVRSVKPHGALYHRMGTDEECAAAVASAVRSFDPSLALVVPAGAAANGAAAATGVTLVSEAFCDRAYLPDGSLVPRSSPGALILDPDEAAARAVALVTTGEIVTVGGTPLRLACDTLCVHGDTPGATAIAESVRRSLGRAGVRLSPIDVVAPVGGPDRASRPG